jgi:hypothetical protein
MNTQNLMPYAVAGALIFAAWKFGSGIVKPAALAVGAVAVAKHIPYVNNVL